MKAAVFFAILFLFVSCSEEQGRSRQARASVSTELDSAVESSSRSEDFQERDRYRHPKETLSFFGVRPDMTVIEIWPSGGWYTEILAPYLAEKGQYIMADPPKDPRGYTARRKKWMDKHPEIAGKVKRTTFSPPDVVDLGLDNSADMVLTFRNVHNWKSEEAKKAAFKSFFTALKPGGILGVVEHRADENLLTVDPKSGYIKEDEVVELAEEAGFILAEKSEINANPKDDTVHPEGVWTLPPTLRLGEKDRAKYLEIGESDRMTLKFVKPEN